MKNLFTLKLMQWHISENKRTMPWKGEKEPYKIWISEVILQQTRALQAVEYYNNFIKEFPTIESLAAANDEQVFKVWEGLGYYSRCKNIILTARNIVTNCNGQFPNTYNDILALKGVGPYTAAAISSFAYGLPHAVADGNVFRVLSRYFGESMSVDSAKGKQYFTALANELLPRDNSAAFNQAIMDFGATVCKPQIPECRHCIFQKNCIAYNRGLVNKLPAKEKQLIKKKRWFTYFIFLIDEKVLINKRTEKNIWQNLYEFYLFETLEEPEWSEKKIKEFLINQLGIGEFEIKSISPIFTQQLTHQMLSVRFLNINIYNIPAALQHFKAVAREELQAFAFPKIINQYMYNEKI